MRQNTKQTIAAFHAGKRKGKAIDSVWTDGRAIYSYGTCILTTATVDGISTVIVNRTKYSVTTSQQQGALLVSGIAVPCGVPTYIVTDLERGATPMDMAMQLRRQRADVNSVTVPL